jgi:hypothetical protein
MAASVSLPTAPSQTPPLVTTPSESFLSRCTEDLAPFKVTTLEQSSMLWQGAATVYFIAFTALAIAAFVSTTILMPSVVPCVGLAILVSVGPVSACVKNFFERSKNADKEADKYRAIQKHYKELSSKTPLQIQAELASRGISSFTIPGFNPSNLQTISRLIPLLAKAKYLDEKTQTHLELRDLANTEAKKLTAANFQKNRNQIYDNKLTALIAEQKAMESKIQEAFVRAVLQRGDYKGTLEKIATLTKLTCVERIVFSNELSNIPEANQFLTFKNSNLAPITFDNVKELSVTELGQRISAAMR